MKARTVTYWICTVLVAVCLCPGGVLYLSRAPDALRAMAELGYPSYFITILGVWKVLGSIAIVVPRLPLLKEWAYAGIIFDLTGASVSQGAIGHPVWHVVSPLVLAAVTVISWALRPASRRLPGPPSVAYAS